MTLTDRLREWGTTHARARHAEGAAARQAGTPAEARRLRQEADRLHREIYGSLDRSRRSPPAHP